MKPGDFFIGLRQLLGVLIPGAIWMGDIFLGILNRNVVVILSQFSTFEIILMVGIIYLIGHGMRRTSFSFGIKISGYILRKWPVKHDAYRGLHRDEATNTLFERVETIITTRSPESSSIYNETDIMEIGKYYILGGSELSRRVEEIEAEINLYASIILPLSFLCISLILFWFREINSFDFVFNLEKTGIIVLLLYLISNFIRRVGTRRAGERRQILLMFLALTDLKSKQGSDK